MSYLYLSKFNELLTLLLCVGAATATGRVVAEPEPEPVSGISWIFRGNFAFPAFREWGKSCGVLEKYELKDNAPLVNESIFCFFSIFSVTLLSAAWPPTIFEFEKCCFGFGTRN